MVLLVYGSTRDINQKGKRFSSLIWKGDQIFQINIGMVSILFRNTQNNHQNNLTNQENYKQNETERS